jgi:hypothetical protein
MAEIQDEIESGPSELEAVESQDQAKEQGVAPATPEIDRRYHGKSVIDVIKMHQEAEKLIQRQSNEVHEVRKLADELIKSQLTPKPKEVEPEKQVDFFENPQEAIRQQIDRHPTVVEAMNFAKQAQAEQARMRLNQLHPDMSQVVQDSEFQNWVKSSKVRQQLFDQADKYDVDAANELLSTYKELKTLRQAKTTTVDNTVRDQSLKAAAVDSGGTGESGKKVYRRADLIQLKMRNPAKYEAMGDEILQAYAEGRVK